MEHVVFYTAADGSPAYRRTANLEDAVRVVEHLRNAEGREEVHVYSLNSVALNFRPYYRVELNTNAPIPAQPDASVAHAAPAQLHSLPSELAAFAAEPAAVELPVPSEPAAVVQQQYADPAAQAPEAPAVHLVVPPAPSAPPALPAPAAHEQGGGFMPMPPLAAPMPPAAEPMPAMAAAGQAEGDDSVDQNGQARGRGLGFFTR